MANFTANKITVEPPAWQRFLRSRRDLADALPVSYPVQITYEAGISTLSVHPI
jgi:hypothetical protein